MKKKDDPSRLRVKYRPDPLAGEATVYYRDVGSGTFDDFVRIVNSKRYKYRRARVWLENNKGVKTRRVFYGRTDAELHKKIKAAKARPASNITDKTTLGDFIDGWLKLDLKRRAKTISDYGYNFEKYIKPNIGKAKILKLTADNFRAFFKEMADDGAKPRTVQMSYQLIHAALNSLYKEGKLDRNPLATVDKPRAPKTRPDVMTWEQALTLLKTAEGTRDYPLILLAVASGMRQGELLALQWKNVNLDQSYLSVEHTLTKDADGKLILDDPKTPESARPVGLDPELVKVLRAHRRANPKSTFVFTAKEGGFIWKDTFRSRVWLPLLEKAKLPHFRFHSLRVFGNTWLANKGTNLRVLQSRLGHSDPRMTQQTYQSVPKLNQIQEAANSLGLAIATGLKGAKNGAKRRPAKAKAAKHRKPQTITA